MGFESEQVPLDISHVLDGNLRPVHHHYSTFYLIQLTEAHEQERPQSFDLFSDMDEQIRAMEQEQRELAVQKAVLKIQHKYGKNAILKCSNLEEDAMTRERNEQIGGHRR